MKNDKNSEWQPIETAPKDGTWVLLYKYSQPCGIDDLDSWLPCMSLARYHEGYWYKNSEYTIGCNPTHWMLLPKPPSE